MPLAPEHEREGERDANPACALDDAAGNFQEAGGWWRTRCELGIAARRPIRSRRKSLRGGGILPLAGRCPLGARTCPNETPTPPGIPLGATADLMACDRSRALWSAESRPKRTRSVIVGVRSVARPRLPLSGPRVVRDRGRQVSRSKSRRTKRGLSHPY